MNDLKATGRLKGSGHLKTRKESNEIILQTDRRGTSAKQTSRCLVFAFFAGALLTAGAPAQTQEEIAQGLPQTNGVLPEKGTATLPLVFCWYKGEVLFYIRTDTSDQATAQQQGLNYVPQLANALTSSPAGYDDIYTFTNSTQFNVVPSAPDPIGPKNADQTYQPLWQVSTVNWNAGITQRTLKSEDDILVAAKSGEVTVIKTNVVINCPIIFRPGSGKLPNVKIVFGNGDRDQSGK